MQLHHIEFIFIVKLNEQRKPQFISARPSLFFLLSSLNIVWRVINLSSLFQSNRIDWKSQLKFTINYTDRFSIKLLSTLHVPGFVSLAHVTLAMCFMYRCKYNRVKFNMRDWPYIVHLWPFTVHNQRVFRD